MEQTIIDKLMEALDGYEYGEGLLAMCFLLGNMGAEVNADKEEYMALVTERVSSAFDYQSEPEPTKQ